MILDVEDSFLQPLLETGAGAHRLMKIEEKLSARRAYPCAGEGYEPCDSWTILATKKPGITVGLGSPRIIS